RHPPLAARPLSRLCVLLRRPPSRSTLFPYTNALPISKDVIVRIGRAAQSRRVLAVRFGRYFDDFERRKSIRGGRARCFFAFQSRDRKSTRLNSSHAPISYAASCLKKKIRPHTTASRSS